MPVRKSFIRKTRPCSLPRRPACSLAQAPDLPLYDDTMKVGLGI
jgi:hypothetical protein